MKTNNLFKSARATALTLAVLMALDLAASAQNEFGTQAGNPNATGSDLTADGFYALHSDSSGEGNTADGFYALINNTSGSGNSAIGYEALLSNGIGEENTASGSQALYSNLTGGGNTANGYQALYNNNIGSFNTGFGYQASIGTTFDQYNTAIGSGAGGTASYNIAIGFWTGLYPPMGGYNINIGTIGKIAAEENSTFLSIGIVDPSHNSYDTNVFIAGISGVKLNNSTNLVVVDSITGQLGTVSLSAIVGVPGNGLVPGAYLYLPSTQAPPAGFTLIGTKQETINGLVIKGFQQQPKLLKLNVYQMN